jgi:Na+/pantothenate symporter
MGMARAWNSPYEVTIYINININIYTINGGFKTILCELIQCHVLYLNGASKMATKIKCAHDHHDLCVKGSIKCLADRQTDEPLYKLSVSVK